MLHAIVVLMAVHLLQILKYKRKIKNIRNVKGCGDGMPKSIQTG